MIGEKGMVEEEERKCECCGKENVIAVACSGLGAFSIGWCETCLTAGVEPYFACVATAVCCGGLEGLNDEARDVITRSIAYHGKTMEQFNEDFVKELKDFDDYCDSLPREST